MSLFKIIYPDIPAKPRVSTLPSSTLDSWANIDRGDPSEWFWSDSVASLAVDYDTGITSTPAPSVVALVGAQQLYRTGSDFSVSVSNSTVANFATLNTWSSGALSESALLGQDRDIYIAQPTGLLTTARYVRASLTHASAQRKLLHKLFLGQMIDIGEPLIPTDLKIDYGYNRRPAYSGTLDFPSISSSAYSTFVSKIINVMHYSSFILWDQANAVFGSSGALYCTIKGFNYARNPDDSVSVKLAIQEIVP